MQRAVAGRHRLWQLGRLCVFYLQIIDFAVWAFGRFIFNNWMKLILPVGRLGVLLLIIGLS